MMIIVKLFNQKSPKTAKRFALIPNEPLGGRRSSTPRNAPFGQVLEIDGQNDPRYALNMFNNLNTADVVNESFNNN